MRRLLSTKWFAAAAVAACAFAVAVAGVARWTTTGSGSTSATVSTLTAPSPAATSPTYGVAHVSWSAVRLDPDVPSVSSEVAFTVARKPSTGSTWTFVCGTGTTPKPYNVLSCDDTPPATDTYDYRVVAQFRSWTAPGVASVAVIVDTSAPTSAISFPGAAVYGASSWNAGCSSSICGTASDTGGSNLQKVEVSIRQGSGNYWSGSSFSSASQVWNVVTGTSSWSYSFAATSFPADGAYTVSSRATDNALNVQSPVTTQAFTFDTTPPVVSASTIAATSGTGLAGFVKQGGGYVVYADATDANGVSSVTANVSGVTTGQTAVALASCASSCTVGGHTYAYKSVTLSASNPLAESTKTYTVSAADTVANPSSPSTYSVVVDNTAPSVATVIAATTGTSPQGFVKQGGTYRVYANVTDLPAGAGAAAGIDTSSVTANVSTLKAGQSAVALSACGGCGPGSAYSYQTAVLTADTPLSEGNKLYSVSASDNLGTSGSSSGANVQADNTAPSVATVIAATTGSSPQGFVKQGGTYRVYANVTDLPAGAGASAGVNAASVTANVSTVSTGQTAVSLSACGGCGPSSAYAYQSVQLTADSSLSEGNKLYSVSASDNLGTSGSSSGANVQVDNTAPSVAAVIANTTTSEAGWLAQSSGYRVYANVTELPAGAGASSGLNAASITADVSNVTTGQTAVALTTSGCPCTISGTSYSYRSAALTSNGSLSAGSKSFTTTASDNLGSATNQSGSVTIDNTGPALSTLQMFDSDGNGKVDQAKATFGETLETYSAGTTPWTLANAPGGGSNTLASVSVGTSVATLTLNEGIVNTASGSFTIALAANATGIRDLAGNQSSFAATSVVDKAAPIAVDVQAVNGVGTAGRIDSGDVVTYTFSEAMSATSILSGWSGVSTAVNVLITNSGTNDTVAVSTAGVNLGTITTGGNYVTANKTVTALMALSGVTVTLTFTSTAASGLNTVASSTMVWTPSASAKDPAGNAMLTTAATESGAPKRNF